MIVPCFSHCAATIARPLRDTSERTRTMLDTEPHCASGGADEHCRIDAANLRLEKPETARKRNPSRCACILEVSHGRLGSGSDENARIFNCMMRRPRKATRTPALATTLTTLCRFLDCRRPAVLLAGGPLPLARHVLLPGKDALVQSLSGPLRRGHLPERHKKLTGVLEAADCSLGKLLANESATML